MFGLARLLFAPSALGLAVACTGPVLPSRSSAARSARPVAASLSARPPLSTPSAERALGASAELVGTEPLAVVPPDSLPTIAPALAKELGPSGRAKLEVAMSVCAASVRHKGGKLQVGCRACPPFQADTGPDGKIAIDPKPDAEFYELEALYSGSFSKAGATEMAAVFSGCESHAENWGGTLLVERRGSVWVATDYRSGFHPLDCHPFRPPDGHDLLVCRWETDHQSYVNWQLASYDFAVKNDTDPEAGYVTLLSFGDNSYSECWGDKQPRLVVGEIGDFRVEPARARRPAQVVVKVILANEPQTPGYWAVCKKMLASESTRGPSPHSALKLQKTELVLVWGGQTFAADPPSTATLHRYAPAQACESCP